MLILGEFPYINTINPNFTFDVFKEITIDLFNEISIRDRVKVDYREDG